MARAIFLSVPWRQLADPRRSTFQVPRLDPGHDLHDCVCNHHPEAPQRNGENPGVCEGEKEGEPALSLPW